jgi:hypothetical protein
VLKAALVGVLLGAGGQGGAPHKRGGAAGQQGHAGEARPQASWRAARLQGNNEWRCSMPA